VQSTLGEFQETKSEQPFALQNSKLLKVSLDQVTIQAKAGSMVAYQGDVSFEHAGTGGLQRMVKKAVTGPARSFSATRPRTSTCSTSRTTPSP
jgi:uncharacterized protein (AIM24 family)